MAQQHHRWQKEILRDRSRSQQKHSGRIPDHLGGLTLIELMVAVAVLCVLLLVAVPSATQLFHKGRLKEAAEDAVGALHFAKSESIKRGSPVFVRFAGGGSWCYGVSSDPGCDCTQTQVSAAAACKLQIAGTDVMKRRGSTDFAGVTLDSSYDASFEPVRGRISPEDGGLANRALTFSSPSGYQIKVEVSVLGRIRTCSPSGPSKVAGYVSC